VVLAVSSESADLVEPYVAKYDIPFPVANGSSVGGKLGKMVGARGIPHSYLLDTEGRLVWHGHPSSLTKKQLKTAMAKAERAGPNSTLGWRGDVPGAPAKAIAAAANGEIGDAFKLIDKAQGSAGAKALEGYLEAHIVDLRGQIDAAIGRGDFSQSLPALEVLAKQLKRHPLGDELAQRQKEIASDEVIQNEIEAADALARSLDIVSKRGVKKAKKSLQSVVKRFPGTHAAKRAQGLIGA